MTSDLTVTQLRALAQLRHPAHGGRLNYRGSGYHPGTWDNLVRRGLVTIEWTVTGARPDGVVRLSESSE